MDCVQPHWQSSKGARSQGAVMRLGYGDGIEWAGVRGDSEEGPAGTIACSAGAREWC